MDKELILNIVKLLSALESWSFAEKHRLPEYLQANLDDAIETLSAELLK